MASGTLELLQKKRGSCVVTSSNTIAQGAARMDVVGMLNNQADEERILALVKDYDPKTAHSFYAATKYALARWARRMSADWGAHGVRINAVAPGITETDMMKAVPKEVIDPMIARIPLRRLGQPEDIANAFVFLASDEAAYITGVVLSVDGMART